MPCWSKQTDMDHTAHCSNTCTIIYDSWLKHSNLTLVEWRYAPAEVGSFQGARCLLGYSPQIQLVSVISQQPLEKWYIRLAISSSRNLYTTVPTRTPYLGQILWASLPWVALHHHLLSQSENDRITNKAKIALGEITYMSYFSTHVWFCAPWKSLTIACLLSPVNKE